MNENQKALNNLSDIDIVENGGSFALCNSSYKKDFDTLQQAINDLKIKNVALERACSMVSFYEGMDYKYFVEKYVEEAKKDLIELKELENGK